MLLASYGTFAQIVVDSYGNIGLGTSTPTASVEMKGANMKFAFPTTSNYIKVFAYNYVTPCIDPSSNGNGILGYNYYWSNVRTYTITRTNEANLSDRKYKNNIKKIGNSLSIINQLNPVQYDLSPELFKDVNDEKMKDKLIEQGKDNFGLIAQEVEEVLPSIVSYDSVFDAKTLSYSQIIPILIKAMQEQQVTIDDLTARIEKLEGNASKEKSATIDDLSSDELQSATLNQNVPNPFTANTTINMYLPGTITKAVLYIYNMQGIQIKNFVLQERGNTSVSIEGYALDAGMYLYTLIADGKEVDTKKMILTK